MPAQAVSLFTDTINIFEDDNIEFLIDRNTNGTDGILDVGDTLRGVLSVPFQKSEDGSFDTIALGAGATYPAGELTAIFELEVISKTDVGGGLFDLEFGAYSGFEGVYGANAVIALYTQNPGDLIIDGTSRCSSVAACELAATNGALWMTAGLVDNESYIGHPQIDKSKPICYSTQNRQKVSCNRLSSYPIKI